ncbi:Smr/MutS family protein [uncultured Croceitalea sp.]|uniref:Smr/MutS family protein n=1 Tax=uncultured Croceitalea sp. TaxID=1798908 RepID=UPI003305C68D
MLEFTVGDSVEVLDETIKGIIIKIEDDTADIESEDGFVLRYLLSQLVKRTHEFKVSSFDVAKIMGSKEPPRKKKQPTLKPKERNQPKFEVDLHIHQLRNSTRGMSNFDILNLQLETAKRQLEFAIQRRIQKVVFIHGVGEGVLKEELNYLFKRYPVEFYDANYQKYGLGATEVYIYQN